MVNSFDKTGGNVFKSLKYLDIKVAKISGKRKIVLTDIINSKPKHRFKNGYFSYQNKSYYYRSSYELEFAQYLIQQNISFEMEKLKVDYFDTGNNCQRIAVPDFIIGDTIVEVKSTYTFDANNMIDKFKRYQNLGYKTLLWLEKEFYELENDSFIINDKITVDNFHLKQIAP
jgi:hypothetical protein